MRNKKQTKQHELTMVAVAACRLLERNPQHLTAAQMVALKQSIERDGFVSPILLRPRGNVYEIVSGNHRFMAAQELGYDKIPAIVADMSDDDAKRLAVNLNMIHGDPTVEQLAPFLADMSDEVLEQIHMNDDLLRDVMKFDDILGERLQKMEAVPGLDRDSSLSETRTCICPTCKKTHIRST